MTAVDIANRVLHAILRAGPQPAQRCYDVAAKWKVSARSLERAKASLGVLSRRDGPGWVWELPAQDAASMNEQLPEARVVHVHMPATSAEPAVATGLPDGGSEAVPQPPAIRPVLGVVPPVVPESTDLASDLAWALTFPAGRPGFRDVAGLLDEARGHAGKEQPTVDDVPRDVLYRLRTLRRRMDVTT